MSDKYTNWNLSTSASGVITIMADREGQVNPALMINVNKETGAVVVRGSPDLDAIECNGSMNKKSVEELVQGKMATRQLETALKDLCALHKLSIKDGIYSVCMNYRLTRLLTCNQWNGNLRINHG